MPATGTAKLCAGRTTKPSEEFLTLRDALVWFLATAHLFGVKQFSRSGIFKAFAVLSEKKDLPFDTSYFGNSSQEHPWSDAMDTALYHTLGGSINLAHFVQFKGWYIEVSDVAANFYWSTIRKRYSSKTLLDALFFLPIFIEHTR